MLILCQECGLQVSDKAISCPHCGFPMKPELVGKRSKYKSNKRKRLPNGFGQISEIKNRNLRKPFRVMVCCGKDEYGKPISKPLKPISYFSTYNEAYSVLVEYNRDPEKFDEIITLKDVYEEWSKMKFAKYKSSSSKYIYGKAWKYCWKFYDHDIRRMRIKNIKYCMYNGTDCDTSRPISDNRTRYQIKVLFDLLFDYALENEYVDKNISRNFSVETEISDNVTEIKNGHKNFTDEEIKIMFENVGKIKGIEIILIECYSGWRPRELCNIEVKNVNLEEMYFIGGMKTKAGTNRKVPIHPLIQNFVQKYYEDALKNDRKYLFKFGECEYSYLSYYHLFNVAIKELGFDESHRPHDCRVSFVTKAKKYDMDEYAIKYIVGHKILDITESTYTKRPFSWLTSEMKKIKE